LLQHSHHSKYVGNRFNHEPEFDRGEWINGVHGDDSSSIGDVAFDKKKQNRATILTRWLPDIEQIGVNGRLILKKT
jgi:hypothetical protein